VPLRPASYSRGLKGDVQELARRFLMFQTLCQHAQRERLHFRHGLRLVGAIAEHAREVRNLGDPSPVLFAFQLNFEDHMGTVALG